ncbi:MAG TPA: hypothetical protein VHE30_14470 [Polyangiaceae bacterium]|nr:hypothetical protein [Polyangiaceae bacterium]
MTLNVIVSVPVAQGLPGTPESQLEPGADQDAVTLPFPLLSAPTDPLSAADTKFEDTSVIAPRVAPCARLNTSTASLKGEFPGAALASRGPAERTGTCKFTETSFAGIEQPIAQLGVPIDKRETSAGSVEWQEKAVPFRTPSA